MKKWMLKLEEMSWMTDMEYRNTLFEVSEILKILDDSLEKKFLRNWKIKLKQTNLQIIILNMI